MVTVPPSCLSACLKLPIPPPSIPPSLPPSLPPPLPPHLDVPGSEQELPVEVALLDDVHLGDEDGSVWTATHSHYRIVLQQLTPDGPCSHLGGEEVRGEGGITMVKQGGGRKTNNYHTDRQTDRQTDRDRKTYRDRDRQTDRQTDRQRETGRHTETETDRQTERER